MYDIVMYVDGSITDIEGNVINKTKSEYPYSYDPIVVFRNFNTGIVRPNICRYNVNWTILKKLSKHD